MKKIKRKSRSLYSSFRPFTIPRFPKYAKASEKHKEIIERILSTKDFCLAMEDSKDRELLTLELIDKVASDIKVKKAFERNVLIAEKHTTIFGSKFCRCSEVLEISYRLQSGNYQTFGCNVDDIKLLIVNDIDISELADHDMNDIKNLVSLLRQKNKDVKVLYIVNDLFANSHCSFYYMFNILNLNVAKLNHMLELDDFMYMFIEQLDGRTGFKYKNLKMLEAILKKHLYIDPIDQIDSMNYNLAKVFEVESKNKLENILLQNVLEFNEESKNYKHISGTTAISNYSKFFNMIVDTTGILTSQTVEKKHYYYRGKDFRIYNECISTGRFSKSKYELHTVDCMQSNYLIKNKNNIRSLHIVVDVKENFLSTFLSAISILYNGDYNNQVRLFIYFVARGGINKSREDEQLVSYFNFENIDSHRMLLSKYQDIRAGITLKSDEEKTFDEIMREILGE